MCKPPCVCSIVVCSIVAVSILAPSRASATPPGQSRNQVLSGVPACLHDGAERAPDRARREQAIALAKAINEREGTVAERTRLYVPLSQLRNLPPAPPGFSVQLYTDGTGYVVSIKDTRDPCRYAVFSDEAGLVYESTALAAPVLAARR